MAAILQRRMNEIPKVVFSKALERADWPEARIAYGDLAHEIAPLRAALRSRASPG